MKDKRIKFKMIKPFIFELFSLLFAIAFVSYVLLAYRFIQIKIRVHLMTITLIIILAVQFISLFSRIVTIGVRALIDYFFQNVKEDNYIFYKEEAYEASSFTEKYDKNRERQVGMYYLIQAKKENEMYTFISPQYIEMTEGEEYRLKTANFSKILLEKYDVINKEDNCL